MTGILGGLIGSFPASAAGAFESIASATGTGSSGNIVFSSIPSTYSSLQLRGIVRDTNGGTGFVGIAARLNSDAGTNYVWHTLTGNGSTVSANGMTTLDGIQISNVNPRSGTTAGVVGVFIMDIHNYASTTQNKTVRIFSGIDLNSSGAVTLDSNLWLSTSAINSITLIPSLAFSTSTKFALYGIKGA